MLLLGCNKTVKNIKFEDAITPTSTTNQPIACNGCLMPAMFNSEEDFVKAINGENTYLERGEGIEGVEFYFVPQEVPDGAWLDIISVRSTYVCFRYTFTQEQDPNWENVFLLEWKRTMPTGHIEESLNEIYGGMADIITYKQYYIVKVKPEDRYEGENEYVCQNVEWEDGKYVFHAVVPIWFTNEDIERYCVAKKVVV